jgi:hypothetical protein
MRQRFTFRGDSLWWFTELYLHKMRRLDAAVETVIALDLAHERHAPASIVLHSSNPTVHEAARAWGDARRVRVTLTGSPSTQRSVWKSYAIGLSAKLPRHIRHQEHTKADVAAFVHTAFWRRDEETRSSGESYIGPVLDAVEAANDGKGLTCIGVGPRRNFRARRWWDPLTKPGSGTRVVPIEQLVPRGARAAALDLWSRRHKLARALTSEPSVREAARVLDCDLWPVLRPELEDVARLQWPWSARAIDEATAALRACEPRVAVTYAEAGGWGRAVVLAARALRVASVGIQHGFIYRHWLNYLHEADEVTSDGVTPGFPAPDRTLVFDRVAAEHLVRRGHLSAGSVRVTGSARLDALATNVETQRAVRGELRRELGVTDGAALVVLAAKFAEIGGVVRGIFEAISASSTTRLIVKAHPAETTTPYERMAEGLQHITVASPTSDLGRLLAAADALVTMNSTVAVDALALGIPTVVVGLPNNLTPFVEAGVMRGADAASFWKTLEVILYDRPARASLLERGRIFAELHEIRASGDAAFRAAREILDATHPTPAT